jgi:signal peptidase II
MRQRLLIPLIVALFVLAADQATKFWAVGHLTTTYDTHEATTVGQKIHVFMTVKKLQREALDPYQLQPVVPGFWSNRYAENPGAAWSFAAHWPDRVRVPFFHIVPLLAILMIATYLWKLEQGQSLLRWALSFVLGGAMGNLTDRMVRGYVIDFIDWHLNDHLWQNPAVHWPTFNVADVGISCGVTLIALDALRGWWQQRKAESATPVSPSSDSTPV